MNNTFRVIITGGRDFNDYSFLEERCDYLLQNKNRKDIVIVVSENADGADRLGERYAHEKGVKLNIVHPAQTGLVMADNADAVIAFWDGNDADTKHMIDTAVNRNMPVKVVRYSIQNKITSFRGSYFFLSNFYSTPVTYEGLTYQNNEAAFQAAKCVNMKDRERFTRMNPAEAKKAGRRVQLRKDWEQVKFSVMENIVREKFKNPQLAEKLIATGEAYIEECNSWGDKIWGTVNIGGKTEGKNHLGLILMKIRSELKNK